jgi:hypothetical protein
MIRKYTGGGYKILWSDEKTDLNRNVVHFQSHTEMTEETEWTYS